MEVYQGQGPEETAHLHPHDKCLLQSPKATQLYSTQKLSGFASGRAFFSLFWDAAPGVPGLSN